MEIEDHKGCVLEMERKKKEESGKETSFVLDEMEEKELEGCDVFRPLQRFGMMECSRQLVDRIELAQIPETVCVYAGDKGRYLAVDNESGHDSRNCEAVMQILVRLKDGRWWKGKEVFYGYAGHGFGKKREIQVVW